MDKLGCIEQTVLAHRLQQVSIRYSFFRRLQ
jgi:hypothetical protein